MSVAGVCRIVASILHNVQLTDVRFDHGPSACVGHDAWRSEGLPVPPGEVVAQGWEAVLEYLRKAAAEAKAASQSMVLFPFLQPFVLL